MTSTRYTLSLPEPLYESLREQAEAHDRSIRDVVRQCLKFGLTAMKISEDPDSEIYFRERMHEDGQETSFRETRIEFIW